MTLSLPPNFVDLSTALSRPNCQLNIIGLVTDFLPAAQSRGDDMVITFEITDASFHLGEILKVRFFRKKLRDLPAIQSNGDIVLLRNIQVKNWSGVLVGLSNTSSSWVLIPSGSLRQSNSNTGSGVNHLKAFTARPPSTVEASYAFSLFDVKGRSIVPHLLEGKQATNPQAVAITTMSANRREKFCLIKDLRSGTFVDLVGQVVKIFNNNGRLEVYLTDYTSNKKLFNYVWGNDQDGREGDEFDYIPRTARDWPGPFGRMTLLVTLWDAHSYFAQDNVKVNDIVQLRNVQTKEGDAARLEANLRGDRSQPDRVNVIVLNDDGDDVRVKDMIRRKRDYWKKAKEQHGQFVDDAATCKRKNPEKEGPGNARAKKRQRQKEKEKARKLDDGDNKKVDTDYQLKKYEKNKHIRATRPAVPLRALHDILCNEHHKNATPGGTDFVLPFQCVKQRATLRVVDYYPDRLEDFAVSCRTSEYDMLSDNESEDSDSPNGPPQSSRGPLTWEWRFYLLVEDGSPTALTSNEQRKERVKLLVAGGDAEFLLKMDAKDLRKNQKTLNELREKLFILWGDLEEKKLEGAKSLSASGKPFECCIKEYGVPIKQDLREDSEDDSGKDGESGEEVKLVKWKRTFRMFGTTIL